MDLASLIARCRAQPALFQLIANAPLAALLEMPAPSSITPFTSLFVAVGVGLVTGSVTEAVLLPLMDSVTQGLKVSHSHAENCTQDIH